MSAVNRITKEDIIAFSAYSNVDNYQRIATKSAIYPGQGTPLGLAYVALKLNGEAGEFAEHVGKAMRDDDLLNNSDGVFTVDYNELTPERRNLIIKEIGDVLWYLSAACNELGISLSEAATINLEKLCDRAERDALRGSGDER
jgi:NTP pyrophosphatase (non-canonical NTP hydrolase)